MHFMKIGISLPMTLEDTFFILKMPFALIRDSVRHMLYANNKNTGIWLTICRVFSIESRPSTHDLYCHRNK